MMAQRRKRRTSIRTAAGLAQEKYLDRIRALRDDPLRVLPECVGGEPKAIARIRTRLERIARGKAGFLDRRDKGVVGAVANILPVADQTAVPRLVDHKIGGQRRFYLQRGHVTRGCSVGVQNHDDPLALLAAYRDLAKQHGLHFFAGPGLWCTGGDPAPPDAWVDAFAGGARLKRGDDGSWRCPHDGARLRLGLRGGPGLLFCNDCTDRVGATGNLHKRLAARYAGPRQRQPVEVEVELPDKAAWKPADDIVASYRAGVDDESRLIASGLAAWRERAKESSGARFVLGDRAFGSDQEAFLDALDLEPWEREALAVITQDGHAGRRATLDAIASAHASELPAGIAALLRSDEAEATRFIDRHGRTAPRDLLRLAHAEGRRRRRLAAVPDVRTGPVGTWIDGFARAYHGDGAKAARNRIGKALTRGAPAPYHLYAFLQAAGGDQALDNRFKDEDRAASEACVDDAKAVLKAAGDDYVTALTEYLESTGTGEKAMRADR